MERATHQTRLQKIVLGWDYFALEAAERARDLAHKSGATGGVKEGESDLTAVPTTFDGFDQYIQVFEKLLLEECKSQIIRGNEEDGARHCDKGLMATCERSNDFFIAKVAMKEELSSLLCENDLLLISKEEPQGTGPVPTTHAFALVESREGVHGAMGAVVKVRFYLGEVGGGSAGAAEGTGAAAHRDGVRAAPAVHEARFQRMRSSLQANSVWWIVKLCGLSSLSREYIALHGSSSLPFMDLILTGKRAGNAGEEDAELRCIPQPLVETLETKHNPSQLSAMKASLTSNPIVLIQGPPGTGKTQTILGLLSVVLHSMPLRKASKRHGTSLQQRRAKLTPEERAELWLRGAPWMAGNVNPRDEVMPVDGDAGENDIPPVKLHETQSTSAQRQHRTHVLVCAPSNAALDEVIHRLITDGLKDENGMGYKPSVVRVGLNAHHSVESVTMDVQVAQRLSSMERGGGNARAQRDRIRVAVLDQAAIVCSTLSFSGSGIFSRVSRGFDVVIIDEAAQAVEPSTLIPLAYGCKQLFLVGDPIQLPATVISPDAVKYGYGRSLFLRLQETGYPVRMLKTQYRMHPLIREFPSLEFYAGGLEDGPSVREETAKPWHELPCFGPFAFFHIDGRETQPKGQGSWVNTDEASFALQLYRHLALKYSGIKEQPTVAVISPYRNQVKLIRSLFKEALPEAEYKLIDINTVDGFQGRERDVAILSCVRTNTKGSIGFVKDYRRMNVGLTRARSSMLVLGCAKALKSDWHWRNMLKHAQAKRSYFLVPRPLHKFFSAASLDAIREQAQAEEALEVGEEVDEDANAEGDAEMGVSTLLRSDDIIEEMVENQGLLDMNDTMDEGMEGMDLGDEGFDLEGMEEELIEEKHGWMEAIDGDGIDEDE